MAGATDGESGADGPPPAWLPLAGEETLQWRGGPRIQTIVPFAGLGLLAILAGLGLFWVWRNAIGSVSVLVPGLAALAVLSGLALPAWAYLRIRNTEYVVTDSHLYRKSGILGRRVTTVGYETVQNVSYSQGITGTLFDHGTVAFDTAGSTGTELAFSNVDDPSAVQQLVEKRRARYAGGDGFGGGLGAADERSVPGTTEQWDAVREEVVALRRTVENRQR